MCYAFGLDLFPVAFKFLLFSNSLPLDAINVEMALSKLLKAVMMVITSILTDVVLHVLMKTSSIRINQHLILRVTFFLFLLLLSYYTILGDLPGTNY